ncbi:MAG: hypothetical protein K9J06_12830 [Flavobacteriales bacterium]|nr:hypothetical protein [Flavobacteriales bacterium]
MRAVWHKVQQSIDWILKNEAFVFYTLLAFHAAPLVMHSWFPTVDGPAHLYNSKLILDDLTGTAELPVYLEWGNLTTNWLGHGFLAILLAVMSAEWAETCIQLLQVLGLPLAFRFIIHAMRGNMAFAVLAFPYSYSFLFFYGFYNFNISLILALLTFGLWWRGNTSSSVRNRVLVMALAILTGFSHIFGLGFLLLLVGTSILTRTIRNWDTGMLKEAVTSFLPFVPSLGLLMAFLVNSTEAQGPDVYQPISELWKSLVRVAPSKGIEYGKEGVFSQWILYVHILMLIALPFVVRRRDRESSALGIALGLATTLLFAAYFILPDGKEGYAGFVNSRLLLLFFTLLALTMSIVKWPRWISFSVLTIITYISIGMLGIYINANRTNAQIASALAVLSASIRPGSVILPYISSDRFILGHISGYLGVQHNMVLLDNYEAALNYFPLSWKESELPNFTVNGQHRLSSCPSWPANSANEEVEVDYVLLVEDRPSECTVHLRAMLDSTHALVNNDSTGPLFLYERRP